MNLGA